jgi:TonB family protein
MLRCVAGFFVLLCLLIFCAHMHSQTQSAVAGPLVAAPATNLPSAKVGAAPLPDPKTPEEFFARARALSDLEASGIPFHLKATYVASGDAEFTGNGTYEEWWQSKDLWRKEATLGDYRYVEIKNGDAPTIYATTSQMPVRVRQMLDSVLMHVDPDVGSSQEWKQVRKELNGVNFVVLTSENNCGAAGQNLTCHVQGYFTDKGVLRIRVNEATEELYNNIQPFKGLLIPLSVTLVSDGDTIVDILVTLLEPLDPDATALSKNAPVPTIPPVPPAKKIRVSSGVAASRLIQQPPPLYPKQATEQKTQGTVLMAATIGTDGRVLSLDVMHSAGPAFDKAAIEAVRRWRYRPMILDGVPVQVEATIIVEFRMTH